MEAAGLEPPQAAWWRRPDSNPRRPPGGGGRTRTDDPLRARQVLSQLSYAPALQAYCMLRFALSSGCTHRRRMSPRCDWPRRSPLDPSPKGEWWAGEDLNLRPHAYQARALTAELPAHKLSAVARPRRVGFGRDTWAADPDDTVGRSVVLRAGPARPVRPQANRRQLRPTSLERR